MSQMMRIAGAAMLAFGGAAAVAPAAATEAEQQRTVFCRSRESYNECRKEFPGPAVLVRQVSKKRCVEGLTWGTKRRAIWVEDGCAGVFGERPEPGSEADAAATAPENRTGVR